MGRWNKIQALAKVSKSSGPKGKPVKVVHKDCDGCNRKFCESRGWKFKPTPEGEEHPDSGAKCRKCGSQVGWHWSGKVKAKAAPKRAAKAAPKVAQPKAAPKAAKVAPKAAKPKAAQRVELLMALASAVQGLIALETQDD